MPSGTWALGWLPGDVVTDAEFKKGFGSIADTTLSVAAATIDFTSIVASYAHLLVVIYGRGDTAATTTGMNVRFNNDSAANYYSEVNDSAGATNTAQENLGVTQGMAGIMPAGSATANRFGTAQLLIGHYANTSGHKSLSGHSSAPHGTATGTIVERTFASVWASTAAINRVTLLPAAGNFAAGTRATIYACGS